MSKILLVGDVHLSDKPPSSCTDSYLDDLFDLLAQIAVMSGDYAAVVQAGDLFHHKNPLRTSHRTVGRFVDWLGTVRCPFYVVPGNHDMSNDRFDSVFDGQPLGVVLRAGAKLLAGWSELREIPLYGVPWLAEWNHRDPETGEHSMAAHEAVEDALVEWDVARASDYRDRPGLIVTHAPFYPPGQELPYEFYPTARLAKSAGAGFHKGAVGVYYGHVHEAHGIYNSGGATFANMGALSRGSLAEYDVKREIQVASWDSETGFFASVPLAYRPAEEVFRLEQAQEIKAKQVALDEFLESIGQTSIEITNVESVIENVRKMGLKPEVEQIIRRLLEDS